MEMIAGMEMPEWIDLTRTFVHGMAPYPGDAPPRIVQRNKIAREGYNGFVVTTGMHVGTHIDAPLHMIEGGKHLSEVPIGNFVGRGRLVDARGQEEISSGLLQGLELCRGDIVLVQTGFEDHFHDPPFYFGRYPAVTEDFAQVLVRSGVTLLGLDTPGPDRAAPFKVHKILLANEILIIENLVNLAPLREAKGFEVIALPVKYHCDGGPVRVIARMLES